LKEPYIMDQSDGENDSHQSEDNDEYLNEISDLRQSISDQAIISYGGVWTAESREPSRKDQLLLQLRLARQLRAVMERAADRAENALVNPQERLDILHQHIPQINRLVSLTLAVRGKFMKPDYDDYMRFYQGYGVKKLKKIEEGQQFIMDSLQNLMNEHSHPNSNSKGNEADPKFPPEDTKIPPKKTKPTNSKTYHIAELLEDSKPSAYSLDSSQHPGMSTFTSSRKRLRSNEGDNILEKEDEMEYRIQNDSEISPSPGMIATRLKPHAAARSAPFFASRKSLWSTSSPPPLSNTESTETEIATTTMTTDYSRKRRRSTMNRRCHDCKSTTAYFRRCHYWYFTGVKCNKIYCSKCLIQKYECTDKEGDKWKTNIKDWQ
jgi:hypothetical protein